MAVPCVFVADPAALSRLDAALRTAERVAIDTEVPIDGPARGRLRVMSVATRDAAGIEEAFVVDARDVDPTLLAPLLAGLRADAWNASFDARVLDAAVWGTDDTTPHLRWWDAQLADALLHQGRSGFGWYHGLAWATEHLLGIEAQGKGTVQVSFTAGDDLSDEQIRYAAADAVETMWVGDVLRRRLRAVGLEQVAELEMGARPFLDRMERAGLPFDWDGWAAELDDIARRRRDALGRLAELTGGGQGSLFDEVVEPTWNPGSDRQVRATLNRYARDHVRRWTRDRHGTERDLTDIDPMRAPVLREIGGELCETILDYRSHAKILDTYGESIREHVRDDGRMHPQYLQVVGTNTGRLASRNPNAQNLSPRMLPHVRPSDPGRVFVHADLSQAELRVLAQIGHDQALRHAFAHGDDLHVATAAAMFGVDMAAVRAEDPERFARLRRIAKALNFGIAYGSGAASLGRTLTAEGTPTTVEEASELLDRHRRTYPGTTAWAESRVAEIRGYCDTTDRIDWPLTLRLAGGFGAVASLRRELRPALGRWPTAAEIAEAHPDRFDADPTQLCEEVAWILGYQAPVALCADGRPFTMVSRTPAGRCQHFDVHVDRLFLATVTEALRSSQPALIEVRRGIERDHGIVLPGGPGAAGSDIERAFEDRALRRRFVERMVRVAGEATAFAMLNRAARERVGALVNAWRNAPVQGAVADIMLDAFADLDRRLRAHPGAVPVQTVHDSVVIECDAADAPAVAEAVRAALEEAMARHCPDVAPRADVDIRTTLADADASVVEPGVGEVRTARPTGGA
jgi:DNA polymerase I-like protein with 3'-5' exonuclease and polymerase domains